MADVNLREPTGQFIQERLAFYNHRLYTSQRYIRVLVLIASVINLILVIPDLLLIENDSVKISVAVIRVVYSLILFTLRFKAASIRSFKTYSILILICEAFAVGIFLFVFSQYSEPNFLIQTLGMVTLIVLVFLIPNRWSYMLLVSLSGTVGFFICGFTFVRPIDPIVFMSAATYVTTIIGLCAVSSLNSERHQFREYTALSRLEHISSTDYLTDAANRLKMLEEAERWLAFCKRQNLPLSLIFFDVDELKLINDRCGHPMGDLVLANLAKLIQSILRSSDTLARWGGDEFVILLPNAALDDGLALVKRIEISIHENIFVEGRSISCSFGIAEMKKDSSFEALVHEADSQMYRAKQRGKDNLKCSV